MTTALILSMILMVVIGANLLNLNTFFNSKEFKKIHRKECEEAHLFDETKII